MTNVFIIHGIYGHPDENWFPWLKKELTALHHNVFIPHFPTKENLTLADWWQVFAPYVPKIQESSVVIGHSLGVAFLLKVLEKHRAKASFFVASAFGVTGNEFDPVMGPIAQQKFDWAAIREHCNSFAIFHSDNDPYLPVTRAEELAKNLHTDFLLVKGAGHFNAEAGYTTFPLLLEKIHKWL